MFSTNGFVSGALAALLATAQFASAHMEISEPAPLRSKFNPNAVNIDYTNTAPLAANGANYPCKGYHSDMGTPAGKATASYRPGGSYSFKVTGGAPHGGGSCQVSLSYDQGKTFTVIQSIIGGCPLEASYPFTVPDDAPEGEALWAWTWQNTIGNREQYMNCAVVTISKSAAKREAEAVEAPVENKEKRASIAFSQRPPVFIANIGNGCNVAEGTSVEYPSPGPDVVRSGSNAKAPSGSCGASAGPAPVPVPQPATTAQAPVVTSAAPAPVPSGPTKLPGGIFLTVPSGGVAPISTAAPAVSSAPVAQPTPSTLVVSTRPAASSAVAVPSQAPVPGKGAHAQGTSCASEGAWNCIDGTSFQRCASGQWSAVIGMAAGTKCTAGEGASLEAAKKMARRSAKWRLLA